MSRRTRHRPHARQPGDIVLPVDPTVLLLPPRTLLALQTLMAFADRRGRCRIPPGEVLERFWQPYPPMPREAQPVDYADTIPDTVERLMLLGHVADRAGGYELPLAAALAETWRSTMPANGYVPHEGLAWLWPGSTS